MKRAMLTSIVVLAWISGEAMAVCSPPYLNEAQLKSLLPGKTVCSPAGCSGSSCKWQEHHQGSTGPGTITGALLEWGPAGPAEPVGTWTITAASPSLGILPKVIHSYGSNSYPYSVKDNGGTYSFCGPNGEFPFSIRPGIGACP